MMLTTITVDWEYWLIVLILIVAFYGIAGRIFRSVAPGGKLSWSGRRWRWTFTVAVALWAAGIPISSCPNRPIRVTLYVVLGLVGIWFVRWWWRDWEKEKAAHAALIEKLHQEGHGLVLPRMSRGQKIWNWVLIVYGAAGLLGGLYEVVVHLVLKR